MKKALSVVLVFSLLCILTAGCGDGTPKGADGIDVDLSVLNETMVSAQLSGMMASPKTYIGKTIKISGVYDTSFFEGTGLTYHYVITKDGDDCCREGMEFMWNGDHAYPEDYPEEKAKIEAVGIFESYEELGQIYYYLAVDELAVL